MLEKMSLGRFIQTRRKYMCFTQEDLAEKVHVSKSAIAKWETDAGIPDRDNLYRLSEILNVTVDDLHRIIENSDAKDIDLEVNITADVIATLESYGYKVIRPGQNE